MVDEPRQEPARPRRGKTFSLRVAAPMEREKGEPAPQTVVAAFDDADLLVDVVQVARGTAQLTLPARLEGQVVTVMHAPVDERVERPTAARLRRALAVEERVLAVPGVRLELPPAILDRWKLSCCRVRGRVFVRVRLPNGTTQERPLCNARVVICEVDATFRSIVAKLPNELLYRLRDEWVGALRAGPAGPAPTLALQAARGGLQLAVRDETGGLRAREPLLELERVTAVGPLREGVLQHIELLKPFWCDFEWLRPFYRVDCIKTVDVAEDGTFDTEVWYPCYGDHPDLYFRVEQDCHPGGWLTVHAPSVHCNTHWDYRCGTPVSIEVTHPQAAPGRSPSPCTFPYSATDPASVGSWATLSHTSGVFVVHAALLPNGKVLLWSGTVESAMLPKESRVWDPVLDTMTTQTFGDDLFCAGHAMLPDGRVLVVGGSSTPGHGIKSTHIFDGAAETWTKVADMAFARWYPTAVTLPNGRVLVVSGRNARPAVPELEVYDPAAGTWTTLPAGANKTLDIYPSLHVMADGKVLYTGTRWAGSPSWPAPPPSELFDPATNTWAGVDDHDLPNRTEGFSVLLPPKRPRAMHELEDMEAPPPPPTLTRVLVVGGGSGVAGSAERSAEIIDLADPAPAWRRIADMSYARTNVNGVLLADGTVLICGGIQGHKWDTAPPPALNAELFDPDAETWTVAAAMATARQYHSVALLLADGRVLTTGSVGGSGGGTNLMSMEVYSPPYLFRGPRPRVTAAPASAGYGATFTVSSPDACRIDRVTLVRSSSITHHTNSDQRLLPLAFTRQGRCDLRITSPASASLAPPGYYLLFLLDDCGVPSVGRSIRIG